MKAVSWRGALSGAVCVLMLFHASVGAASTPVSEADRGAEYPPVVPGASLVFPRDHGAHPEYRTEWWYVTGWLRDDADVERGFQVTFFRVRPRIGEASASRFAPNQLMLAHAAVADPAQGKLLHAERAERMLPPAVSADENHTDARIRDWSLSWITGEGEAGMYRARISTAAFSFELELSPDGAPLLNGRDGFSQKAPDPIHASYYYSRPQLSTTGRLNVGEGERQVRGKAWLDHEWSSEIMPEQARGWDWIGINLIDGGALMAFRMRAADGTALYSAGTLRQADGSIRKLAPHELRFEPTREWRSPRSGAAYPVEWLLHLDGSSTQPARRFRIKPLMDDQELDSRRSTGAIYWEGAVRLLDDLIGGGEVGKGYLEMTGYSDRLRM